MGLFDWFKKNKKDDFEKEITNEELAGQGLEQATENEALEAEISVSEAIEEVKEDKEEFITEEVEQAEKVEEPLEEAEVIEEVEEKIEETEEPKEELFVNDFSEPTEVITDLEESEEIKEEEIKEKSEVQENIEEETEVIEPEANINEEEKALEEVAEEKPKGFFAKIKSGLAKTRANIMSGVEQVLKSFTAIDEDFYEELEEALIMADLGVETSVNIIEKVRECVKKEKIHEVERVKEVIVRVITEMLEEGNDELQLPSPSVILVIGVNGVGKTTTIGKLTNNYKKEGKSVLLAAADTFRAAAIDQLEIWGERNDVTVIKHQENSDPAAVVFDAVQAAKARKSDVLICDTAGRLHNKKNLMEELRKIAKVVDREYPQAHTEVFLVLDATTGQNALQQAKLFKEVADISGIVLTKLDGTAKGGIVIAIKNELNIPVRYIGVGEGIDDLQPFNANDFAKALFSNEE